MFPDEVMNAAANVQSSVADVHGHVTHYPAVSYCSFWIQTLQDYTVDCLQVSSFLKPTDSMACGYWRGVQTLSS